MLTPLLRRNWNAASASTPGDTGSFTESRFTSSKPARSRMPRTRSGSPNEKGPGTSGGGSGSDRPAASASRTVDTHSFLGSGCHARRATRPPGRSAPPMLVNAATGSSKNMMPNRLIARSNGGSAKRWTCASACRKVAFVNPSAAATSRARASIFDDRSIPSALPAVAARARRRVSSARFRSRRRARARRCRHSRLLEAADCDGRSPRRVVRHSQPSRCPHRHPTPRFARRSQHRAAAWPGRYGIPTPIVDRG